MANYSFNRNCGYPPLNERDCGCYGETADVCSCCEQNPADTCHPPQETVDPHACTCCKASMRDALKLLCCNAISDLVNFDAFAFISDINYVGTTPIALTADTNDNLDGFEGSFRRFSPCNCDLLDITGTVYTPSGLTVAVNQANLCTLNAIAFELLPAPTPVVECSCDTDANRFRRVRELLQCELRRTSLPCGECAAHCNCTDDCCCTDGVLNALSGASLSRRATLSAGLLSVQEVSVLGSIGTVLVLANETQGRFYFVCANKVDFFA